MPQSENKPPAEFSRTKLKNEMLELQDIGKTLIDLPEAQLAKIPLPDILLDAIRFAHTLKKNEAKRRHLQYVGKLMRKVDAESIKQALTKIQLTNAENNAQFHEIERCRDELILKGDEALQKLITDYPQADRQYLRQLLRKIKHDQAEQKNSGAYTELFKYLRGLKGEE